MKDKEEENNRNVEDEEEEEEVDNRIIEEEVEVNNRIVEEEEEEEATNAIVLWCRRCFANLVACSLKRIENKTTSPLNNLCDKYFHNYTLNVFNK